MAVKLLTVCNLVNCLQNWSLSVTVCHTILYYWFHRFIVCFCFILASHVSKEFNPFTICNCRLLYLWPSSGWLLLRLAMAMEDMEDMAGIEEDMEDGVEGMDVNDVL